MILSQPRGHTLAQIERQPEHFLDFDLRDAVGSFVVRNVALLAEQVEFPDLLRFQANRKFDGLNDPVVMTRALGLIPAGGEGSRSQLKRGVVCDIKLPVGDQTGCQASVKIAVGDCEQVRDLLPAGPVLADPPELEPVR